jgi:hypothetical protein
MNKKNTDDSNNKRLESLKRQAEEFKQKKFQIRNDLTNAVRIQLKFIKIESIHFILFSKKKKRMAHPQSAKTIRSHSMTQAAKKTLVRSLSV